MESLDPKLLETLDPGWLAAMVLAFAGVAATLGVVVYRLLKHLSKLLYLDVLNSHADHLKEHDEEFAIAREERAELRREMDDISQLSDVVHTTAHNVSDIAEWVARQDDDEPIKKKLTRKNAG